ncbi:hypothetical protein KKI19_02820 [Patescibacteria group bacterium]|nr:hypothetical protein [Patescibacteria group bacterium]
MKEKILPILIFVFLGLAVANLIALDISWLQARRYQGEISFPSQPAPSPISTPTATITSETDTCGPVCQETINQKVAEAIASIPETETVKETTVVQKTTETVSQPTVIYIPLGGGGSTTSLDWADVGNAEVYLDISDYPNLDRAYFEGFIRVKHGNGRAFARLYDVTHSIGVQGGEIYTNNESFTLVESGSLSFWQGKNLYRVQVKSLNGYEAFYDSGRIKLILK